MFTVDYEVRTPNENILLFIVEKDERGNTEYVVRKGSKEERLSLEELAKIFFELIKR